MWHHLVPLASGGQVQPSLPPPPGRGDSPGRGWGQGWVLSPTWFSLCCRLSSSCSKGHCSRLASSSSFFFLMSWFRLRCSRTRCSSGLLSTPRPLGRGSCQECPVSPHTRLKAAPHSDTNLHHRVLHPQPPPPWAALGGGSHSCPLIGSQEMRLLGLKTPVQSKSQLRRG